MFVLLLFLLQQKNECFCLIGRKFILRHTEEEPWAILIYIENTIITEKETIYFIFLAMWESASFHSLQNYLKQQPFLLEQAL